MSFLDIHDPFEILNINRNSDQKTIKDTFHNLSKAFHPDKHNKEEIYEVSKAYFEKISNAYKAIETPFSRVIYSRYGYKGLFLL